SFVFFFSSRRRHTRSKRDWSSDVCSSDLKYVKKAPKTDAAVMIITVIIVLLTDNLAIGVVVGVVFSALFFATKISEVKVDMEVEIGRASCREREWSGDGER